MQQIGDRIHSLRKGLGISQGEFGSKIGIKKSSVSSMEKNKSNPSTQTIKLICVEFNVNYDWLVNGVGDIFIKNNNSIHERIKYLRMIRKKDNGKGRSLAIFTLGPNKAFVLLNDLLSNG